MGEINLSFESPVRGVGTGEGEPELEIIEFTEEIIVLRGVESGRTWGVSLNSAGTEQEELSVTELERVTGARRGRKPAETIAHHWV